MTYVFLGAGRGIRMGDLTSSRPKILLDVDGQPILARNLDAIAEVLPGMGVLVVTGYAAETVDAFLSSGRWPGARTLWNPDFATAGPLRSLALALDQLPPESDTVTIGNGDTIYETAALRALLASRHEISLLASPPGDEGEADDVQLQVTPDGIRAAAKGLASPGTAPVSAGLLQIRGAKALSAVRTAIAEALAQETAERRLLTWHSIVARLTESIPQAVIVPHDLWWEFDSSDCIARYTARKIA